MQIKKNQIRCFCLVFGLGLLFTLLPELHAAGLGAAPGGVPGSSLNSGGSPQGAVMTFAMLMQRIADGLAAMAAAVAILFVVINGARLTFAFGNTEDLSKARKGLMWAAGGLVLIIFAYIITKSVIALTYSGADGSSPVGTAMIEAPGSPSLLPVSGAPNPDGRCRDLGSIPLPCYGSNIDWRNETVNVEDPEACNAQSTTALAGVCSDLGVSDCTMENLQGAIDYSLLNVPQVCSTPDGLYGQCTFKALQELYRTQCIQ